MNIFKNAWNKVRGIFTGGSDSNDENISQRLKMATQSHPLTKTQINILRNLNRMNENKKAVRRMRRKMRRETQQNQRG